MPETVTASLRRRLSERGGSIRAHGRASGVSFNVLSRFLRGSDMTGANIDRLAAYLGSSHSDVSADPADFPPNPNPMEEADRG